MNNGKPYSPACDRNRDPILAVLKKVISTENKRLLEVGSGTGQHAVYFAPHFPWLEWVTSDVGSQHEGIRSWIEDAQVSNVSGPIEYEIGTHGFPQSTIGCNFDIVYSANVLHIISWKKVETFLIELGRSLRAGSQALFYGPFNYEGSYTSESNKEFDRWLKDRDPLSGIRDFENIDRIMLSNGFSLLQDYEMPSNNRILHFRKD